MLVLVADAHVQDGEDGAAEFRRMLRHLASLPHDVCFLGDIFELWIGLPGYGGELVDALLCWCLEEKDQRRIFLVEGNHEFFVVRRYGSCFTAAAAGFLRHGDWNFCHGDLIPRSGTDLLLLRRLLKNSLVRLLMAYLPGARGIVWRAKAWFHRRSQRRCAVFPRAAVEAWATQQLAGRDGDLFLGHFHRSDSGRTLSGAGRWHCVPAWKEKGEIGLYDPGTREFAVMPWTALR